MIHKLNTPMTWYTYNLHYIKKGPEINKIDSTSCRNFLLPLLPPVIPPSSNREELRKGMLLAWLLQAL